MNLNDLVVSAAYKYLNSGGTTHARTDFNDLVTAGCLKYLGETLRTSMNDVVERGCFKYLNSGGTYPWTSFDDLVTQAALKYVRAATGYTTYPFTGMNDLVATAAYIYVNDLAVPSLAPANTVAPVVTGTSRVGQLLSVTNGTWTNTPLSYTYQWKADGVNISGATSNTFTLTTTQIGAIITCLVSATNADGTGTRISNATTAVLPLAPTNSVAPAITGTPTEGQTLNASTGTWANTPTGYSYQWKRSTVNISGATNNNYTLTSLDVSTTITVTVTASNAGGSNSSTSSATATIAAATLQRYMAIYDGDIDSDSPAFSSGGTISGLNESDDEAALPLALALQDWVDWRAFFCGAQDGNVAGAQQVSVAYEDGIDNVQTYMPSGVTVMTKAQFEAKLYQNANITSSGNVQTPSVGYRVSGDAQYAEAHACAQVIIALVQEAWCVPGSTNDFELLHWHECGAPTLRAQVFYEAITLGQLPDIASRIKVWKASKQNDTRDINARRFLMGHNDGTPADGIIGYGPVASGTAGGAGALRLVQFGGPSGNSRQEDCCNDDLTGGKAFYLASVVPAGAIGSRIDRMAYASDSKSNQTEYYRAADGVVFWNFARMAAANNFSPTAGLITTGGGALMQTYLGTLWADSNRNASIAVTKSWPTGYGDTSNSLSKTDWQAFVTEMMDRYRLPRPTTPAYTSIERGTLSAGSVTPRAPTLLQAPQGIYNVTLAEGVTVNAWKSRWAQGIWGGSYHLSGGMTYLMGLVERVGVGAWNVIGTHASTFTSQAIPTFGDGLTHEIAFKVTATNAQGSATTYLSLGTLVASVSAVAPNFTVTPVISGSTTVGSVLTCDGGTVTGTPTPTKTYQWQSNGTNISGETATTYTTVIGDVGNLITCEVVATNIAGSDNDESNGITVTSASTIFANDTFTEILSTALTSHTSDSGHTWAYHSSNIGTATVETNGYNYNGAAPSVCYLSATPPDADYSVTATLTRIGTATLQNIGVLGRVNTAAVDFYHFRYNQTSNLWQLLKRVANTETILTTAAAAAIVNGGPSVVIKLEMIGTAIKGYVDGVLTCSATDGSVTAAGKGGIRCGRANITGVVLDNLIMEDI